MFRVYKGLTLAIFLSSLPAVLIAAEKMDEVVVRADESGYSPRTAFTATKTDTPIRDIPASVIVIPKEVLKDQGTVNMNQAVNNISGVTPVMAGGYGFADNYLMRGLRMRFLRDGLSDGPSMNGYYRSMTEVERIEALKGPGSALYGRTEPGGVINVTTKKPSVDPLFDVELSGGSFGTYRAALDAGGSLNPALPARMNASYYHTEGFRDLEKKVWEALPTVGWKINDQNSLTIDYDFRNVETVPDNYGILFAPNGTVLPVDRETKYYSPFNTTSQTVNRVAMAHDGTISDQLNLRNSFIFDKRHLYLLRNAGGSVNASLQSTGRTARAQTDKTYFLTYQSEATYRFATGRFNHVALGGLEYEKTDFDTKREDMALPNIANVLNPVILETTDTTLPRTLAFDRKLKSDTIGFYGQEQIEFTEQVKARGGMRLDHVAFSDEGRARYPLAASPVTQRTIEADKNLVSWQVGAVYQPWQPLSLYTGYSEGSFINIQTESTNLTTDPEQSAQIEVGFKTGWWNDRLKTNVALFRTTRENYYVTLVAGGEATPVGKQQTDGVEMDVIGTPIPGLNLTANYAVFDARIKSRELSGSTSIQDKWAQSVPYYQGAAWAVYEIQSGRLKGIGIGGGPSFKGSTYADALSTLKVPAYVVGNAVVYYRRPKWDAQVNVNNITDKTYYAFPTFSGATPGDPLSVYATLRTRFF